MMEGIRPRPLGSKGIFTLSIDTELAWGGFDRPDREARWAMEENSRAVIQRLLDLFARYDIAATWALVGHLFLDRCRRIDGHTHPEMPRPRHAWFTGDWYGLDPATDIERSPLWYGTDIVRQLLEAEPRQEIASHSFAHIIFADPGCSAAAAEADLEACVDVAREWGLELRSFVYPRNRVGHQAALGRCGFRCYRGADPVRYSRWPRPLRRLAHYMEDLLALPPPTVQPVRDGDLWNIPGSLMLQGMDGVRALIPAACRTQRCMAGLRRAVERRDLFHLWFHPANLAIRMDRMIEALDPVLAAAAAARDRGDLEILTMGSLAMRMEQSELSHSLA
jgi:hypothetical protein